MTNATIRITRQIADPEVLAFAEQHGMDSDLLPPPGNTLSCDATWLVARSGGDIRAVAALSFADDVPRVGVLCVHLQYRRRGIGTRLLQEISREALRRGSTRLMVTGIDLRNPDAVGFLTSSGFRLHRDGVRMEWVPRDLPVVSLPSGYGLRSFRPGDEAEWAYLINRAYSTTPNPTDFTAEKVLEKWVNTPFFLPDGSYFVTWGGRMVGCFMAWKQVDEGPRRGRLHWLAVDPDHRRKGIARFLTVKVIRHLQALGLDSIFLDTGYNLDIAMKIYRDLGFVEIPRLFDYVKDLA